MLKIDLHTHSIASPDGGLGLEAYRSKLTTKKLDYIAITDHDSIDFAVAAKKELGDHIIIGEEISTQEGEIIGLFLNQLIPPGMSAKKTAQAIKKQNGIVYIPHPFETLRKGITQDTLDTIVSSVDIVEAYNGRTFQPQFTKLALEWSNQHKKAYTASSDAHGRIGWGKTYSEIAKQPTRSNLVQLLKEAELNRSSVGTLGRLHPTINRLKKRLKV